jgi:hypothetical protein
MIEILTFDSYIRALNAVRIFTYISQVLNH